MHRVINIMEDLESGSEQSKEAVHSNIDVGKGWQILPPLSRWGYSNF